MGRLIAMLGERYRDRLERGLTEHGFTPLFLPDNPALDARLAGHADLSVFNAGNEVILSRHLANRHDIVNNFTLYGIQYRMMRNHPSGDYPGDAALCACRVGNYIIHNRRISDPTLTSLDGFQWINVRQGYAACAACVVDSRTIITADHGIVRAARANGIECCEIQPGGFLLDGFKEGFIGGSMFRCGRTLYCTGESESSGKQIPGLLSADAGTGIRHRRRHHHGTALIRPYNYTKFLFCSMFCLRRYSPPCLDRSGSFSIQGVSALLSRVKCFSIRSVRSKLPQQTHQL